MTLPRPFYVCVWLDSYGEQGGSRFYAVDDDSAIAFAGRLAELSGCKLIEFGRVQDLGPISTHAAAAGSNVQDKTWFHYKSTAKTAMRISLPAIDRSLLEQGGRRTAQDRITGATALTTRHGATVQNFVRGINLYGARKRDYEG